MITEEFIENFKKRIGLLELASRYMTLDKAGSFIFQGRCPNPNHRDSSPSFTIDIKRNIWCCYGCHQGKKDINNKENPNYGTDNIALYQWIQDKIYKREISSYGAICELCEMYDIPKPTSKYNHLYLNNKRLAKAYYSNLNYYAKRYLYDRGLCDKDIKKWNIGYINDYFGDRIVFPLCDRYGAEIAFIKRLIVLKEGDRKYKNSSNGVLFNKSSFFYGLHNISSDCNELRITEGTMDVIMADKYKAKNVVATLGTAFTEQHVKRIKDLKKVPVFILDSDEAGETSLIKSIKLLADENIYSKILILPKGMDLCDQSLAIKYEIEDYINTYSITYGQYKLDKIINGYNSLKNEYKMKYLKEASKVLDLIPTDEEKIVLKGYLYKELDLYL